MTEQPHNLVSLVEKLHQEYVFVSLYKPLIRQSLQELNDCCEDLFRTLWINHALAHSLSKLLSYERISCAEWIESSNRASSVRFLSAAVSLPTSFSVERYSHLLGTLRASPTLLADVVRWADTKAMDVEWLVRDVFSVVYGQCVFEQDHNLALQFLGALLERHVNGCDSVGALFVDAEPALSSALCAYTTLIPEFKLFLVASLRDPLTELLLCSDYLEYDITKAGKRLQSSTGDSPRFLFSEDLDTSCQTLARITNVLFDCMADSMGIFPVSLKYLTDIVKTHAMARWPQTSAAQLRKPISNLLFGIILGTPIVGPETWGIVPADVVISQAARYNLCQVMSVIQACGWSHNQQIYKVLKHIDLELFKNIVDGADGGQDRSSAHSRNPGSIFPIVSGLHRSAYLVSMDQLQNMANLVVIMLESLRSSGNSPALCRQLESLNAEGIGRTSFPHPYSSSSTSTSTSDTKLSPFSSSSSATSSLSLTTTNTKAGPPKDTKKKTSKKDQRSLSAHNLNAIALQHAMPTSVPKSTSGGELTTMLHAGLSHSFPLPSEVFVLPCLREEGNGGGSSTTPVWDFNMLSEEEFMSCTFKQSEQSTAAVPLDQTTIPCTQAIVPPEHTTIPPPSSIPPQQTIPPPSIPPQQTIPPPFIPPQQTIPPPSSIPPQQTIPPPSSIPPQQTIPPPSSIPPQQTIPPPSIPPQQTIPPPSIPPQQTIPPPSIPPQQTIPPPSIPPQQTIPPPSIPPQQTIPPPSIPPQQTIPPPSIPPQQTIPPPSSIPPQQTIPPPSIPPQQTIPPPSTPPQQTIPPPSTPPQQTIPPPSIPPQQTVSDGFLQTDRASSKSPDRASSKSPDRASSKSPDITSNSLAVDRPKASPRRSLNCTNIQSTHYSGATIQPVQNPTTSPGSTSSPVRDAGAGSTNVELGTVLSGPENLRLPPPIPPRRTQPINPSTRSSGVRNVGSMIETTSPERVSSSFQKTFTKRRSQSELDAGRILSPSTSREQSPVKKDRQRLLSANTSDNSGVPLLGVTGQSAQEFRQSQYCTQLSYKLRLIFQSTQTLLTTSLLSGGNQRVLNHGGLGEQISGGDRRVSDHGGLGEQISGGDWKVSDHRGLREQMVALLKGVLAHRGWMGGDLDASLVVETLKMVIPLSDELLAEALAHMCDETMRRAAYIAYLVKSHQRFQGNKAQLTAALDLANRTKSIRESMFVNFIVEKFLVDEKDRVSSLLSTLENNSVSDEKVTIMEASIEAFSYKILQSPDLTGWSDTDAVMACLEDHLFTLAYPHVFHPNGGDSDALRDQIFSEHLCKLSSNLNPSQPSLQIPVDYHISCPWVSAQQQLRMLQLYKSPRGKLRCVVQCCKVLISLLQYAKCGAPPGADDMFPVLVYVLIKANPPNLLSTIQYVKNFAEVDLKGEEAYWWIQFSAAVEFTKTI